MLLALDIGTVRIGCALADEKIGIPFPKAVLETAQNRAEKVILKILKEDSVTTLIVGLPLDEDGNETSHCEFVRRFCTRLMKRALIRLVYVDEADSSEEAKELLREAKSTPDMLDAYAACCILSRYINQSKKVEPPNS